MSSVRMFKLCSTWRITKQEDFWRSVDSNGPRRMDFSKNKDSYFFLQDIELATILLGSVKLNTHLRR